MRNLLNISDVIKEVQVDPSTCQEEMFLVYLSAKLVVKCRVAQPPMAEENFVVLPNLVQWSFSLFAILKIPYLFQFVSI